MEALASWWRRHHLIVTCMAFLGIAAVLALMIALRLWNLAPDFDWGSAGLLDAVRMSRGLPVYEDWQTGHPTWLYGPGFIWVFAALFTVASPSNGIAVAVVLLASAASIAIFSLILKSRIAGWWLFAATLSFVLIEGQAGIFGSVRPDSFALLFALGGLCLCYRGDMVGALLGGLLIALATLTKQPMLASAIIPPLALALEWKRPSASNIFVGLIPLAMVAMVFLGLRSNRLWWFYVVEVSSQYSSNINYRDFAFIALGHVTSAIPLWIAATILLWQRIEQPPAWWRLLRWSLASAVVSTLVCSLAAAKFGGGPNSMVPAWFAMVFLSWIVMIPVLDAAKIWQRGWIVQSALLVAMLFYMLPRSSQITWPLDFALQGSRQRYLEVSQRVRELRGTVMSPGDVMLTFRERGQLDRSLWFDIDILKWPASLPETLLETHYSATNIVTDEARQPDFLRLRERGYVQTWVNGRYAIWSRGEAR